MPAKLTDAERDEHLPKLQEAGWAIVEGRDAVRKTFTFGNFVEAWGFMTKVALAAEKLDHHPEWSNVYKSVDITLSTHDVGGLSALDVKLARRIDALAGAAG
jgi:4a-hydroxytetrahydrobiopterin dehydratase